MNKQETIRIIWKTKTSKTIFPIFTRTTLLVMLGTLLKEREKDFPNDRIFKVHIGQNIKLLKHLIIWEKKRNRGKRL